MLSVLSFSFNAVAPLVLLIALGYYLRQSGFFTDETLRSMNRFNFRYGFMSLLFYNVYTAKSEGTFSFQMVAVVLAVLLLLTVIGALIAEAVTGYRPRKPVLVQSAFRSNYAGIGLPLAESLGGAGATSLASILQVPTVIYYNMMSVIVLSLYQEGGGSSRRENAKRILKGIATNPLIIGLVAGTVTVLIRGALPLNADQEPVFLISRDLPWLFQAITYLSRLATPIALIVLGGQLDWKSTGTYKKELVTGILLRLVLAPVIGYGLMIAAGRMGLIPLTPVTVAVFTAIVGSPLAVSSVVMSAEMGGDDKLAGQIVVWTSVLGMVSLFVIISILRAIGLL